MSFSDAPAALCIDNAGGVVQADLSNCLAASVPTGWTSPDAIASYLGIAATDAARVAAFLAMFANDAPLGPADAWQQLGDEDPYWPAALP